jgi:dienelactone hydrolase
MRRLLLSVLVLALLSAACGDDEEDTTPAAATTAAPDNSTSTTAPAPPPTTEATTTTEAATTTTEAPPSVVAADLAAVGPYPVGVTTRELATGNLVEIWYPAGPDAEGRTDTYAVRDFTPDIMRDLVPEDTNDRVTVAAGRDTAAADDGPFPLVLFSHGSTSFRFQSTNLAHHLASWGMVVASADHPSRGLVNLLGGPEDPPSSVDDTLGARELVVNDDLLGSIVDNERVGVSGHSAGGGTTLGVTAAGDIVGYVSYASGASSDNALPDVPSMFMAGEIDTIIDASRTRDAFDRAPAPSWYLEFTASGHLAFSDLCAVGDGDATLIGLAEAAGLSDFLNDDIRRLGTDGCEAPNRPVTEVWPGIHQATTGFWRFVFGLDPEPIGVDGSAVDGVTTDAK